MPKNPYIEHPTDKDIANKFEREANYWREEYLNLCEFYDGQAGIGVAGLAFAGAAGALMATFVCLVVVS